jgi:hypothetical protein
VIARVWSARCAGSAVPSYRAHLEGTVLPVLRRIGGYAGARLLTRPDAGEVEILVVTWSRSMDAIRSFADADAERAVVDEEVRPLLSAWDDRVSTTK